MWARFWLATIPLVPVSLSQHRGTCVVMPTVIHVVMSTVICVVMWDHSCGALVPVPLPKHRGVCVVMSAVICVVK